MLEICTIPKRFWLVKAIRASELFQSNIIGLLPIFAPLYRHGRIRASATNSQFQTEDRQLLLIYTVMSYNSGLTFHLNHSLIFFWCTRMQMLSCIGLTILQREKMACVNSTAVLLL